MIFANLKYSTGIRIKLDERIMSYKAEYIGGHSAFPKPRDVNLVLKSDFLEIPEFSLKIPYGKIRNVRNMTQEKLSALRLFLVDLVAFGWTKKKLFMVLTFEDEAGIENNPVFDVEKIEEAQLAIYQEMMKSRGVKITTTVKNQRLKLAQKYICESCAFFRKLALCPLKETNPKSRSCKYYKRPK